jgi:type I site-specific restriction endonuclease
MKLSEVVTKYIELRDKKAELKAEYDNKVASIDEVLDKIEVKLLQVFEETGSKSFSTPNGTAYASVRTSASVADKEAFMEYVKNTEQWPLLEVRASKTAVEQHRDLHEDLPPGINWREERVVNIRRS